jgi:hypothetical protein
MQMWPNVTSSLTRRAKSDTSCNDVASRFSRQPLWKRSVQLVVVALGGLGQLRCDVEFIFLIELQARCVHGFELFREQILHDKHIVGLHSRDAARALLLRLKPGCSALAVFRDKHVVSKLKGLRSHVHLAVVLLNSSYAITRHRLKARAALWAYSL